MNALLDLGQVALGPVHGDLDFEVLLMRFAQATDSDCKFRSHDAVGHVKAGAF